MRAIDDGLAVAVTDAVALPAGPCDGDTDSHDAVVDVVHGHAVAEMLAVIEPPAAANDVPDNEVEKEQKMLGCVMS